MKHILATLLCLATTAFGGTYYVTTTGSDAADGSQGAPWATIDYAADHTAAGDTVIIAGGIYREKVAPNADGDSGNPITLWTDPGDRAIISGSDQITGWTQCTQGDCPGNPNYADIYYADIAWYPVAMFQDLVPMKLACEPSDGWYQVESAPDDYQGYTLRQAKHNHAFIPHV